MHPVFWPSQLRTMDNHLKSCPCSVAGQNAHMILFKYYLPRLGIWEFLNFSSYLLTRRYAFVLLQTKTYSEYSRCVFLANITCWGKGFGMIHLRLVRVKERVHIWWEKWILYLSEDRDWKMKEWIKKDDNRSSSNKSIPWASLSHILLQYMESVNNCK